MNFIMNIILCVIGVVSIISALIINTKGGWAKFLIKIFPLFAGLFEIVYAVINMGVLSINI